MKITQSLLVTWLSCATGWKNHLMSMHALGFMHNLAFTIFLRLPCDHAELSWILGPMCPWAASPVKGSVLPGMPGFQCYKALHVWPSRSQGDSAVNWKRGRRYYHIPSANMVLSPCHIRRQCETYKTVWKLTRKVASYNWTMHSNGVDCYWMFRTMVYS